jgi:hypothetical protein
MRRKTKNKTKNISISVPSEKIEFIDRRAAKLGLSRSQYLCQLVRLDVRGLFAKELVKNSHRRLKSAINPLRL